jgi:hypothetical protein
MEYEIVEYVVMYSANKFSPRIWLKDSAGKTSSAIYSFCRMTRWYSRTMPLWRHSQAALSPTRF